MIGKAVIIIVVLCSICANGICPARENDTTVVLPYKTIIGSSGLDAGKIKTTTRIAIKTFLARSKNFALIQEYPAVSCKQIAELRPNYDSGYYWIKGVSGAAKPLL